jgi:hypothetical protein
MRVLKSSLRPHLLAALGALVLIGSTTATAHGAPKPRDTCAAPGPSSQVFLPFADPAFYYLAPDGTFESRAWRGGTLVAGNEPYGVGGKGKRSMLVSGSAVSTTMCIAFDAPTIRFFARRAAGTVTSSLGVSATAPIAGQQTTFQLAPVMAPDGSWVLTAPTPILANFTTLPDVLGTLAGRAATRVTFTLTPSPGSAWQVDDFYVDPYRRN